jgi:hypothetical protein
LSKEQEKTGRESCTVSLKERESCTVYFKSILKKECAK